ncbi:MAG: ArnT family glycosyltransferase [Pseudodesulfovibrio sp.]|uniref:ArnT family glycosyltransferase n=1 Tax=Pseudodesulfovibrio sp. TaxID=2035812 RepID=UPI003D0CFEC9
MLNIDDDMHAMKITTSALLVMALFAFSFAVNLYNNGFDYRLHIDEHKKVRFIKDGSQDFMHPTFMLKLSKVIKKITRQDSEQRLAVSGRSVSAFMGACIVIAVFFLSRQMLTTPFALSAALSVAVSPIIVIHSHYLKEDVYFAAALLFSLLFFIKTLETGKRSNVALFGLFFGLALSSQYKSALMLIIFPIIPFVDKKIEKKDYAKELAAALSISVVTFLVVNYNIFIDAANAYKGLSHEITHIQTGHSIHIYPLGQLFLFHYKYSLIPGITLAATVICTMGYCLSLYGWKRAAVPEKTLLLCITAYYFAHEISPLKPAPDFMRYMIPIAPMLIIVGWLGIERTYHFLRRSGRRLSGYALLCVAALCLLVLPAYDSANLVANLVDDTRMTAARYLRGVTGGYLYETYGLPRLYDAEYVKSAADIDLDAARRDGICHVVASSMEYDKYYYGSRIKGQDAAVYGRHAAYERLFRYPYVEIRPKYKTYAFSNPTIRIVDICAGERE